MVNILPNPYVALEPLEGIVNGTEYIECKRIGEIFHLTKNHLTFVCTQCSKAFPLYMQFTQHVQTHFQSEFIDIFEKNDRKIDAVEEPAIVEQTDDAIRVEDFRGDVEDDALDGHGIFECFDCHRTFKTQADCSEHIRTPHPKYRCIKCNFGTSAIKTLSQHAIDCIGEKCVCLTCGIMFGSRRKKLEHLKQHERKYHCMDCDRSFMDRSSLRHHRELHSAQKEHECDECSAVFKYKRLLQVHRKHEHSNGTPINPYKCIKCDFATRTKLGLHVHAKKCVGENCVCRSCGQMFENREIMLLHWATHEKLYQCAECGQSFINSSNLHKHTATHKNLQYKCEHCEHIFKSAAHYRKHMKAHSSKESIDRSTNGNVKCNECNQIFGDEKFLQRHRECVHNAPLVNKVQCEICDKMISVANIALHKRYHNDSNKYRCSICGYRSATPSAHKRHQTKHSEQRDFQCHQCPKRFKTDATLRHHQRVHEKRDYRYPCTMCNRTFASKTTLKGHLKRHTGNGLIPCSHCDRKFVKAYDLKLHMERIAMTKDFKCDLCEKAFKDKHHLIAHRRIHTEDFRYLCKWCDDGFHDLRAIRVHTLKEHGRVWNDTKDEPKKQISETLIKQLRIYGKEDLLSRFI